MEKITLACWCCECQFGKGSDCDASGSQYNHTDEPFCAYCHEGSWEAQYGKEYNEREDIEW